MVPASEKYLMKFNTQITINLFYLHRDCKRILLFMLKTTQLQKPPAKQDKQHNSNIY